MTTTGSDQTIGPVPLGEDGQRRLCGADLLVLVAIDHHPVAPKVSDIQTRQFPGAS